MGMKKAITVIVKDLESFPEVEQHEMIDLCEKLGLDAETEYFDERGVPVKWDTNLPWEEIYEQED